MHFIKIVRLAPGASNMWPNKQRICYAVGPFATRAAAFQFLKEREGFSPKRGAFEKTIGEGRERLIFGAYVYPMMSPEEIHEKWEEKVPESLWTDYG